MWSYIRDSSSSAPTGCALPYCLLPRQAAFGGKELAEDGFAAVDGGVFFGEKVFCVPDRPELGVAGELLDVVVFADVDLFVKGEDYADTETGEDLHLGGGQMGGQKGAGILDAEGVGKQNRLAALEQDDLAGGLDGLAVFKKPVDEIHAAVPAEEVGIFAQLLRLKVRVKGPAADVDDLALEIADRINQTV